MGDPSKPDSATDHQAAWRDGALAIREGRPADALALFQRIIDAGQEATAVWIGVAMAQRHLEDRPNEIAALQHALRLDPRDLRALLMTGDYHAAGHDARAADSYYNAFLKLAELLGDPALKPEISRVRALRAKYAAAFDAHLRQTLENPVLEQPQGRRMRRSLDLLLGKSELYVQRPRHFYFPELPNIEYADRDAFPWLDRLEAATGEIREELLRILEEDEAFSPYIEAESHRPAFDDRGMLGNPDWSAFYLWKAGAPVPENAARCPATLAALAEAPLCRIPGRTPSILFSLLRPGMHIEPHHGFMNARYICHLPLIVPPGCAMRVGSETRSWAEGRACVFDDSIEHEAWNKNPDHLRVVLIFDFWRPELTKTEQDFVSSVLQAVDAFSAGELNAALP